MGLYLQRLRAAVVVIGCTAAFLSASASAQPSLRAFWADAFSVGYKNSTQVSEMVGRAVAGRFNVIIMEVLAYHDNVGGGHGAYYNSAFLPRASDISSSFDALAEVLAQGHAAGLEVHAWIVPFRVSSAWPPNGNPTLAGHPEWLMVPRAANGGGAAPIGSAYTLDPGSPDVQEYLTEIVRELVTNYAVDGINLDYIRYVQTDAGYPADSNYLNSGLKRFQRLTGFVGVPAVTGVASWDDFRRQSIDELIRRLRGEIPSIRTNPRQPVRFSADLICFGNAPASFSNSDPYRLFQNWRLWMERGWLDTGIPMNYKREHSANEAQWYRNWVNAAINWSYNRHIVAGQAPYLNTKANSITQMSFALNAGTDGVCTFSYDATADENTNGTPETDWTFYPYMAANLFTAPAAVPDMPWRDPAVATEGTLWGRVTNGTTDETLDGATITIGALPAVQTDGNGYFTYTLIPATQAGTTYSVNVNGPGCPPRMIGGVIVLAGDVVFRDFEVCPGVPLLGDMDLDGDVDFGDFGSFLFCYQGPDVTYGAGNFCLRGDVDADADVDMHDFAGQQRSFGQ